MRTHLFSSYCSSQKQTSTFAIFLALLLSVCVFSVVDAYSQITIAGTKNQTVNDGVDIFSGKLANTIPLLEVKGRGDVKVGLSLPLRNFDWTLFNTYTQQNQQGQNNYYYEARLAPKLLNGVVPSSVPIMSLTRGGYGLIAKMKRSTNGVMPFAWNQITVTGLEFISNDGTVMGFRDVATDGQPINATELGCYIYPYPDPPPLPEGCSRGRVFRSVNVTCSRKITPGGKQESIKIGGDSCYEEKVHRGADRWDLARGRGEWEGGTRVLPGERGARDDILCVEEAVWIDGR